LFRATFRSSDLYGETPMSKFAFALAAGIVAMAAVPMVGKPAQAADLLRPARQAPIDCGRCGCLHVTYDHHRVLESTYGTNFDPRSFDQTEPYYYWAGVQAFPRFWVDGSPYSTDADGCRWP